MLLDALCMFSDRQAVTATVASEGIAQTGPGDAGPSEGVSVRIQANGYTGSGTLGVQLRTSDTVDNVDNPTALTDPEILETFQISNEALLKGGKLFSARLPHGCKEWVDLNYVVSGTITGGNIIAFLVLDSEANDTISFKS